MDHARCCDELEAAARGLIGLLEGAEPETTVPTCPGWSLGDLVEHVGTLYRWSAAHVERRARTRLSQAEVGIDGGGDSRRVDWVRDAVEPMLATFRSCDPEATVWGWGADRHGRFWPRRMLHETVIHGADAAAALGVAPAVSADVAVDGLDELLANVAHAAYFAPHLDDLRGEGERLGLFATDAGSAWQVKFLPTGYFWDWAPDPADVDAGLRAGAADLLLGVYGRADVRDEARFERIGRSELIDRLVRGLTL